MVIFFPIASLHKAKFGFHHYARSDTGCDWKCRADFSVGFDKKLATYQIVVLVLDLAHEFEDEDEDELKFMQWETDVT